MINGYAIGMKWQTVYFWFKFVDCLHCIQRHVLLLHLIARVLSNQAKVYFWNTFQQIFVWLFRFGIQHARVRKQHILISAQGRTQHTGMKKNLKLLKLVRQRLFIFMHENILKIWFIPREVWYEGFNVRENQINLLFYWPNKINPGSSGCLQPWQYLCAPKHLTKQNIKKL